MDKEKKRILDEIVKYAIEAKPYLNTRDGNASISIGKINYYDDDLLVINKIVRMLELGLIDEKEYYRLMELYYDYTALEEQLDYIYFSRQYGEECEIDDQTEREMHKLCSEKEAELEKYQLLSWYVEPSYLMDSSIKLVFSKEK